MDNLRRIVIGGNWKMNLLSSDIAAYAENLKKQISADSKADVIIAPPFVMLPQAIAAFRGSDILIAAQNVSEYDEGAYTGEVSARQLRDLGVTHVIVGHSERRALFGETDEVINKKLLNVLKNSMQAILCVGESEDIREAGNTCELVASQLKTALNGVEDISRVIIAYEPVWAIGTGKTATALQAEEVCSFIRGVISELYAEKAHLVSIIYGGSMNADNAMELLGAPNIDGGLIGGASLVPESFAQIINTAKTSIQEE